MPQSEFESTELDALRHKVTQYEAALRSAAPRLAAFKRLEQLARAEGTSPDAIASQASVEVMKREKDALVTLLAGLATERDQLKGEVAMLLINKTEASKAVDGLRTKHDELNLGVAELVEDLGRIRGEAARLVAERAALSSEVEALRAEVRALEEVCLILESEAAEHAARTPRVGENRRAEDVGIEEAIPRSGAVNGNDQADGKHQADDPDVDPSEKLTPRRTTANSIDADAETEELESQRFDAFFHAEIDHDKARDWILG